MTGPGAGGAGDPAAPLEPFDEVDTVVGPLLVSRGDEVVAEALRRCGEWEATETRYLSALLRPGQRFVDVGAHVGYFTVLAAQRVGPTGSVLAFEPEERNLDLLRRNVARRGLGNVEVLPVAAARSPGRMSLVLDERNRGAHHLVPLGEARTAVDCVRLDDVLPGSVDVVKVDAQGYDHEIVAGMQRSLAENPRMTVMVELSVGELDRRRLDPAEVLEGYESLGCSISMFDRFGWLRAASTPTVLQRCRAWGTTDFTLVLRRAAQPGSGAVEHADRPGPATGLEVGEGPDGLVVRQPALGRVHRLSPTAALIFTLCTGAMTVTEIAACVQQACELPSPPTAETEQCLDSLRRAGLVL